MKMKVRKQVKSVMSDIDLNIVLLLTIHFMSTWCMDMKT